MPCCTPPPQTSVRIARRRDQTRDPMLCTSRSHRRLRPRTGLDRPSRRHKPRDSGSAWHFLWGHQGAWPVLDTGHTAKHCCECNGLFGGGCPTTIGDQVPRIRMTLVKVDPGRELGASKQARAPFNARILARTEPAVQTLIGIKPIEARRRISQGVELAVDALRSVRRIDRAGVPGDPIKPGAN